MIWVEPGRKVKVDLEMGPRGVFRDMIEARGQTLFTALQNQASSAPQK
jgi:hypothetical protein